MMTPEAKVKERVKALLRQHKAYWHMPVSNGLGAPALDFHVCHAGRYLGIETKAQGKKPTPRQAIIIREINQAGGATLVIDGEEGLRLLEFWLLSGNDHGSLGRTEEVPQPDEDG